MLNAPLTAHLGELRGGGLLCRQSSTSEEAVNKGGGYLYFLHTSGRKFPTVSGRWLIANEIVYPQPDGLLDGIGQTFVYAGVCDE